MKKFSLTTSMLAAIAGSALLTGIAFASDTMRTSDTHSVVIATSMTKPADVDNDAADRDNAIAAQEKAEQGTVEDDVDKDADEQVDNDNDEANENDVDNDKDKDKEDKADTDNDDHGQAVSANANKDRHGDKHSDRGR